MAASTSTCKVPSSDTFSFTAPGFPVASSSTALLPTMPKQRRVSMALQSSPRIVDAAAYSFRDDTGLTSNQSVDSDLQRRGKSKIRKLSMNSGVGDRDLEKSEDAGEGKKLRKKWSKEETQMLVDGCNVHGVGNWKAILSDTNLIFDNRSPVDLKDRFRTYFPDAYRQHYPNAKTHLSSKVRSTLPDGSSIFEKTRSKKRRPFTEEEDRALKEGYEKHGTVWATIVKEYPVFGEQGRRSTDLRDRFRNAFPELYQAAGYKPRNFAKKRAEGVDGARKAPIRAATDDTLAMNSVGVSAARRGRRARSHTSQGLLRGGTKSVPQSTMHSEDDEDSSPAEDDDDDDLEAFKRRMGAMEPVFSITPSTSSSSIPQEGRSMDTFEADVDMDPLGNDSQNWSHSGGGSGLNTPTHSQSSHHWSTAAGSPTSSHLSSDYLMGNSNGMIGKSAWGTQDWFSANPRLDHNNPGASSPFSLSSNLNHGVMDRYDLFPSTNATSSSLSLSGASFPQYQPHHYSDMYGFDLAYSNGGMLDTTTSEVGFGDNHSSFSDEMFFPASSGFRGFTHHSNYAGDLIFGARTHQPQQTFYGSGFGFGSPPSNTGGLGLSGVGGANGATRTPVLPGIDEIELTGISLGDGEVGELDASELLNLDSDQIASGTIEAHVGTDVRNEVVSGPKMEEKDLQIEDLVDLSAHDGEAEGDIGDNNESHDTPPATPAMHARAFRSSMSHTHSQPRRSSHQRYPSTSHSNNRASGEPSSSHGHGRSISVPPSERGFTSTDGEADSSTFLRRYPPQPHHSNSQPAISGVTRTIPLFHSLSQDHIPVSSPQSLAQLSSTTTSPFSPGLDHLNPMQPHWISQQQLDPSQLFNQPHTEDLRPSYELYDLPPFLDLHYWRSDSNAGMSEDDNPTAKFESESLRQGQALDLAQPHIPMRSPPLASTSSGLPAPYIFPQYNHAGMHMFMPPIAQVLSMPPPTTTKPLPMPVHQRRQSALSSKDLLTQKSNDNKRKRASWDGRGA